MVYVLAVHCAYRVNPEVFVGVYELADTPASTQLEVEPVSAKPERVPALAPDFEFVAVVSPELAPPALP